MRTRSNETHSMLRKQASNGNSIGHRNGSHYGNGVHNHHRNGRNGFDVNGNGNGVSVVPDETLLKRISRHQQSALKEFYGRHHTMLRNVVDTFTHEGAETDDVLQEVFLQIWKEANHYSPKVGKPLGWVVTIARRRAIDRLRRRQAYCPARDRYGEQVTRPPQRPRKEAEDPFVNGHLRQLLKDRVRCCPTHQH